MNRMITVGLVQRGIANTWRGPHRRIKFDDVVAYKDQRTKASQDALQELVDQAQELDMGY